MNARRSGAGFTLVEALIALAIFSFLGVGAYQLLGSTGALMNAGESRFEAVAGTQLALRMLEDDFTQLAARPVVIRGGQRSPALDGAPRDGLVEFTRSGWRNPLGAPRSRLQRVAWNVDADGRLLRSFRGDIDAADEAQPVERAVVTEVESLEFRYLDDEGNWEEQWPPAPKSSKPEDDTVAALPRAVEIRLVQSQIGEVARVVPLR